MRFFRRARRAHRSTTRALLLVATSLSLFFVANPQPASAAVAPTDLGTLGCSTSSAAAILDSGQVVGQSCLADGTARAFSWTEAGGMIDLGALGGSGWTLLGDGGNAGNSGVAVSDTGQAVGTSNNEAFSWTQSGGMIGLGTLPGDNQSNANAVNNNGQVVGYSAGPLPDDTCCEEHAFSWTQAGGMVDLGTLGGTTSDAYAVNDNGQVVGNSTLPGDTVTDAFSWTQAGGMIDLGDLGGTNTTAEAVNDSGQVVGSSTDSSGDDHAFSWTQAGGMVDLGTLGGSFSIGLAVNGGGEVVGYSSLPGDGVVHPFVWSSGVMTDLGTPGTSFTETFANAVNDDGEVVGEANSAGNNCPCDAFTWTPAGGMVDLGSLGTSAAPRSATTTTTPAVGDSGASAVNDLGQAAGHSTTTTGQSHAALWSPALTSVDITGSRHQSVIHQAVTFKASVFAAEGKPTGTVSFYDSGTLLGTATVTRGRAVLTTSLLSLGNHSVSATYSGNTDLRAGTSKSISHAVTYRVRLLPGPTSAGAPINLQLLDADNFNLSSDDIALDAQCIALAPATSCSNPVLNLSGTPLQYVAATRSYYDMLPAGLKSHTKYDLIVTAQNDPVVHVVVFTA